MESGALIGPIGCFHSGFQFTCLHFRTDEDASLSQPRLITRVLRIADALQVLPLLLAQLFERAIVSSGVIGNARTVQLLDHGHVQSLLRDQDFDVAAPTRRRNSRIKQSLRNSAVAEPKRLIRFFASSMTALIATGCADHRVR